MSEVQEPSQATGNGSFAESDVLDTPAAGGLLIRGGAFRLVGYLAGIGLSVLSSAVLTRYLGVSRFGQYTTVISVVSVITVVTDAGMSNIGTREYAVLRGEERDRMMRDLLGLRIFLSLMGVVLAVVFALAAGYDDALVIGAAAASFGLVALVYQHTLSIPLTAELRLGTLSGLELARQVLSVGAIVALVVLGAGVIALLAVPLVVNAALTPPTARLVRGRISSRLSLHPRAWQPLLRATVVFALATAVGTIYVYTTQILTSFVTTRHESGLFAVSFRVFIVSAGVPALLVGAALPLLSRAARDDTERLAYALQRIFEVALVGGVGAALVLSAGSGFVVSVIAGPKFAASASVLSIQACALVASSLVAGWSFALLALRLHRGLLASNAAALCVSVVLTLILASADGAQGAAIATVCNETTLALAALIALTWRRPRYRPKLGVALKVSVAAGAAVLAAVVPSMPSIFRALVAAVVYLSVILVTRALPAELKELLPSRGVQPPGRTS